MFVNTGFSYDGMRGEDMYNLMVVRTNGGVIEQNFGIKRKPVIDEIKYKSRKYFYRNANEVYSFPVQFAKEGAWTFEQRTDVTRWFFTNTYRDFTTDDFPELVFKVMATGDPKFYNTSNNMGYLQIEFDCDQAYAYSPLSIQEFDLSSNTSGGTIITLSNSSNVPDYMVAYAPELQIEMKGDTAITFTNNTAGGKVFGFTGLNSAEIVYVNGETGVVLSNTSDNPYAKLQNLNYLDLSYGQNQIKIVGRCILQVRSQYPMII